MPRHIGLLFAPCRKLDALVTLDTSKCFISKDVRFVQLVNISCISVTFEVSKLLTSNVVKFEQRKNIKNMLVTFEVSKLLKSNVVILAHP